VVLACGNSARSTGAAKTIQLTTIETQIHFRVILGMLSASYPTCPTRVPNFVLGPFVGIRHYTVPPMRWDDYTENALPFDSG
jgi:hypothetical protein